MYDPDVAEAIREVMEDPEPMSDAEFFARMEDAIGDGDIFEYL